MKERIAKKLSLKKETIVNLNRLEMNSVQGGEETDPPYTYWPGNTFCLTAIICSPVVTKCPTPPTN